MVIMEEEVVIVGAGIAGLATAVALKRLGVSALVLERSQGLRTTGAALALFPNAWLALDALGVSHKLTSVYAPIERGLLTDVKTGAIQEVTFTDAIDGIDAGTRPVHRKALLQALADELPIDTVRFSSKVAAIETQTQEGSPIPLIHLDDGTIIKAKMVVGCDGVHSVVGNWLGLAAPVYSGRSAFRGLAVFPQGHGLSKDFRQFLDVGTRAGFAALNDKEIYWFFVYQSPQNGENNMARNPELIQKELLENYAKNLPPLYLDVVRHCDLSTLSLAPLMFRLPWDIMFKSLSKDNITVAGDAMHPMTPDLGQGGCSALEDAVVLGRHIGQLLTKNGKLDSRDIGEAIDGYVKERKWRVSLLVVGSYVSGWIQQGSNWWIKFLRGVIFYRFFFTRIVNAVRYDCGKLPSVSFSSEGESASKID